MNTLRPDYRGIINIGQHVKKTGYLMFRFLSKSFLVEPFISISNEEMETNGLALALQHLRNEPDLNSYKRVNFDDGITNEKMLKIKRNHVLVSLVLLLSDREQLKMTPLHFRRGWALGARSEEVQMFPLPMTNREFTTHLAEALEIAS